jgi:hypothetical protein
MAHTCNPSSSGGRDQEDRGLKLAQANSSQDPISKIPITKSAGGVPLGEGPEFKPQCHKKDRLICSRALVVHACNPSYLEGRNQEDLSSRTALAKSETLSQKYKKKQKGKRRKKYPTQK